MEAARSPARRREVAMNIMHVPQKRTQGVLESCEKRLCRALDIGGNRSHEVKTFVASLPLRGLGMRPLNLHRGASVFGALALGRCAGFAPLTSERLSTQSPVGARGEHVCVIDRRHFFACEYLGRKPGRIKFNRLMELAEATR
jgi:hypothetical protein